MKIILIKGAAFPPYNLGHPVDGNPIEVNDDLGQKLINAKIAITEAQAKGETVTAKGPANAEKGVEVDDSAETTTAKEKEDAEKAEKKGEATETATAKGPANAEKAVAPKAPKAKK